LMSTSRLTRQTARTNICVSLPSFTPPEDGLI
jgi:hypothetical protein